MAAIPHKLTPNRARIAEAILYLIERAEQRKLILTQYDIVKALFVADTGHLETYGRPITFDNYAAMKDGPVPSEAYDMLKEKYPNAKHLARWPLWERRPYKGPAFMFLNPVRQPDLTQLSISERRELAKAQDIVLSLDFDGTRDMTHEHPAYVQAWKQRGDKKAAPMDYLLIVGDEDVLHDVVFASRNS